MKVTSIVLGTMAAATVLLTLYLNNSNTEDISNLSLFNDFKTKYNKSYSAQEGLYRFKVFQQNLEKIQKWQKTPKSFEVGINKFSDLTWAEFKAGYLMPETKNTLNNEPIFPEKVDIDWRDKNIVTQVKDQGQCGSCWAFSTTGSMESFLAQQSSKKPVELSEQQLVDCSTAEGNMGCNGGLMTYAYDYIAKHGLKTEKQYPYTAQDGECQAKKGKAIVTEYKILDKANVKQLTQFLQERPVSVAIEVQDDFQAYTGGVYKPQDPGCGQALNHGVLLVGQKDNYYIVKNSWGADWGEKGYIRMVIGKGSGSCGIANAWDVSPTK